MFLQYIQILVAKKCRYHVILCLIHRHLVPNCGPQFILEDELTTYTEFLELPPEKILSIFKKLTQYPEFDSAILRSVAGQDNLWLWLGDESENEKPKSL